MFNDPRHFDKWPSFAGTAAQDVSDCEVSLPCSSGYVPAIPGLHRAVNLIVGLLLLVVTMQFFVLIGTALLLTQGPAIFYAGKRLGKGRKPFDIYKFRTLDSREAAKITPDRVLPHGSGIETPIGKFLRASRLDELPQILNVIRGDMALIGPRPVRPGIAAIQEAENPNYAIRYTVLPGLIGHTQAYMCHGSSKRLRSKLNHMLCQSRVNYAADLGLLLRVGAEVLLKSVRMLAASAMPGHEDRAAARLARRWHLEVEDSRGRRHQVAAFHGDRLRLANGRVEGPVTLFLTTRRGGLRRIRIVARPCPGRGDITFVAANEYASHYLGRYLLNEPVVPPRPGPARRMETGSSWWFVSYWRSVVSTWLGLAIKERSGAATTGHSADSPHGGTGPRAASEQRTSKSRRPVAYDAHLVPSGDQAESSDRLPDKSAPVL